MKNTSILSLNFTFWNNTKKATVWNKHGQLKAPRNNSLMPIYGSVNIAVPTKFVKKPIIPNP